MLLLEFCESQRLLLLIVVRRPETIVAERCRGTLAGAWRRHGCLCLHGLDRSPSRAHNVASVPAPATPAASLLWDAVSTVAVLPFSSGCETRLRRVTRAPGGGTAGIAATPCSRPLALGDETAGCGALRPRGCSSESDDEERDPWEGA